MKKSKLLINLFLLLILNLAHAQDIIPGFIPRFYSIEAATDLPIPADLAHARALQGEDISKLDPSSTTNLWSPSQRNIQQVALLANMATVTYIRTLPSRNGLLRFSVLGPDQRELTIIISKKVHNFLLRKNILNKIGYQTPPMTWLPKVKVQFKDTIDRDLFKEDMSDKLLANRERWITNEKELTLSLQDVLIQTPEVDRYNLTAGLMSPEIHQGRRLLRATYVPLALVDANESINLMPWQSSRIVLNNLKLLHTQDLDDSYGTSWEDARWIARRLARLNREDFIEIVNQAFFPPAVAKLLTEKIISRRNDLIKNLSLDKEFPELPFSADVDLAPGLVKGEIVQEFFEGYATRFSYGDPESPFSSAEMGSYVLSRVQSELITQGMRQLNELFRTDDESNYRNQLEQIIKKEGELFSTQAIVVPTLSGNITLSRDVITGTYMGTNNKVQLVDNFGYAIDAGAFAGIEGIPAPVRFSVGAGLNFQRMFSHIKPIQSLKKSLREPYKNLAIPLLLKDLGKKIDQLTTVDSAENQTLMQTVISELKSQLAIGESFIITDSIVPRANLDIDLSLSQFASLPDDVLKVYASAQAQRMILTRFHFHRADEHTFHIYQDYAKGLKLMLTLKLRSYVPLLAFNARWNKASAETHFYPISLHPREATVGKLKALRLSLLALNHSALQDEVKPHKVESVMQEAAQTFQFLVFKNNKVGSIQDMRLTHARGGEVKSILRRYDATTDGIDTESYVQEAINTLLSAFTNTNLGLSQVMTLNSGFTVGGKAKNRIFLSEYDGSRMHLSYERIMNGWKITQNRIKGLIDQLNNEVGRVIIAPLSLRNTDSILLYQFSASYTLTHEGILKLLNAPEGEIRALVRIPPRGGPRGSPGNDGSFMYRELTQVRQLIHNNEHSKGLKALHSWLKSFHTRASFTDLEKIVGAENFAYQGRVEGFRQGDESGDQPIFSHVYGELPIPLHTNPTREVQASWGILEGELLSNWVMERAI